MVRFFVLAVMLVTELYAGTAGRRPSFNLGTCSSFDVSSIDGCGLTTGIQYSCSETGVADSGFSCDEYFADSSFEVFSTQDIIKCVIVRTEDCATGAQQDILSVGASHVAGASGTFAALPEWVWGMCIGFVASFIVMLLLSYIKDQRATKSQYVSIDDGEATIKLLQ